MYEQIQRNTENTKIDVHSNVFKIRLDKFWSNQEILYDYHAVFQGTGSRSVIN